MTAIHEKTIQSLTVAIALCVLTGAGASMGTGALTGAGASGSSHVTVKCTRLDNGILVDVESHYCNDVSLSWAIYDGDEHLVELDSDPPRRVPPDFSRTIRVPSVNYPYTLIVGATDSAKSEMCVQTFQSPCIGAKSAKTAKAPAPITRGFTLDCKAAISLGNNKWQLPVVVSGSSPPDEVKLFYDAFYRDWYGSYHRVHGFPRNGGVHTVDTNHTYNDPVSVDASQASYPILFVAYAIDENGTTAVKRSLIGCW